MVFFAQCSSKKLPNKNQTISKRSFSYDKKTDFEIHF